ncbi:LssY C-terminal domain-containing protein [Methyloceanibacter caenitepidi]|uniref:LssY C-terminal domain-containing protein n=1 Tax=Methyloceanibacter caenitepidi TaxID=1384459 RepID=UPI0005F00990|nr:LssY C-terminal domain-containing protein [Methyloceanibacter caenitepidi]
MRLVILILQRLAVLALGAVGIWLIVNVFQWVDGELPSVLALAATYGLAAYVILPYIVRMGLMVLRHKHVPSFTLTGDGLPGDPVNLALEGTFDELRAAFAKAGWHEADPLTLSSSWGMVRAFVLNTSYPKAPFSTLYLFGRGQDIGFQKPIGKSPRKRHHVRFWAKCLTEAQTVDDVFWHGTNRPDTRERVLWVGAGTKDTGFSLTRLTFQITHATDADTNAERDFIMAELSRNGTIGVVDLYEAGEELAAGKVNHYVTDGIIAVAPLLTDQRPQAT